MKETLELVGTYGMPIVLTAWFVFRIDNIASKMVGLLEAFIKWSNEREVERKERDKEQRDLTASLIQKCSEVLQKIAILEVKVDK